MKRLFLLFAVLGLSSFAFGGEWLHNYDNALAKSKQMHKPIIMMYSAKE